MRDKVKAIIAAAVEDGCTACVLGCFGCGAFKNPPELVAAMFREELALVPLQRVDFCIFDDHNVGHKHNPRGNFTPFKESFEDWMVADMSEKARKAYIKKDTDKIQKRLK